jgi:hypothetical protein
MGDGIKCTMNAYHESTGKTGVEMIFLIDTILYDITPGCGR